MPKLEQMPYTSQENEDSGVRAKNERMTLRVNSDEALESYEENIKPQLERYVTNAGEFLNQVHVLRDLEKRNFSKDKESMENAKTNLLSLFDAKLFVDFYGRDSSEAVESLSGLLDLPVDVKEELQERVAARASKDVPTLRQKQEEITQTEIDANPPIAAASENVPMATSASEVSTSRQIPKEIPAAETESENELMMKLTLAKRVLRDIEKELRKNYADAEGDERKTVKLKLDENGKLQDRLANELDDVLSQMPSLHQGESDLFPDQGSEHMVVVRQSLAKTLADINKYIEKQTNGVMHQPSDWLELNR
ncbi:MAG: hypothetical protein PHS79_05500 [Patescibacteria group bacterium]|nr:hypothetical protein [Patescibacteria group bacterium]